ncbi:MAG TPA: hypothetical protein VF938_10760, partial [Candidatus Angelobacter sp.]
STGEFLENRGTKVDTHVHLIAFGYLALMLALVQPWVRLSERARRRLAWLLVSGAVLLPVGVFLIHYVGLAYSPLQAIGWASIFADLGGLIVLAATVGYLSGIVQHFRARQPLLPDKLLGDRSSSSRGLLAGGLLLILAGFVHGAYYAGADLYRHEAADYTILSQMSSAAAAQNQAQINQSLADYGQLQGDKTVKIAAHAHIIEFGLLAMLLAFFQPYVQLSEAWKLRWAMVLLCGSLLLPVCVLMEMKFGLLAGGIADIGGLLVILALFAMWIGILRYTGSLDAMPLKTPSGAPSEGQRKMSARQMLLFGGVALAILGMSYGLWYAIFAEHQALDGIGHSLASGFQAVAERNSGERENSLLQYRQAKYAYDRQVDVHGHWIGLAMLLIVLAIAFDHVGLTEKIKLLLAGTLLLGAALFPLGVLLQTWSHGALPRAVAILGSALVIAALTGVVTGFLRRQDA